MEGFPQLNKNLKSYLIELESDLRSALLQIQEGGEKILFVVDEDQKLLGCLTDGDIRRWILARGDLHGKVREFFNPNPISVQNSAKTEQIKKILLSKKITAIPIVDERNVLKEIIFWEDMFQTENAAKKKDIKNPVVIMAGGKGTRLDPFTRILPKPLIPIGEKPIIEIVIEKFRDYNLKTFFLSVNYKSKIIKSYFEELNPDYEIEYIIEKKPLGTAGSLKSLEGKFHDSLLVTNCDVIIDTDYSELVKFHDINNYELTLVASLKQFRIPYGICEIGCDGKLIKIKEKPEYNFLVNTGMYILKPEMLKLIPKNRIFHMTQLIEKIKQYGGGIGIFPISEKSWIDTGEWEEYKKAMEVFKL
jgi:dTDP-glucose pyrophosphorylase